MINDTFIIKNKTCLASSKPTIVKRIKPDDGVGWLVIQKEYTINTKLIKMSDYSKEVLSEKTVVEKRKTTIPYQQDEQQPVIENDDFFKNIENSIGDMNIIKISSSYPIFETKALFNKIRANSTGKKYIIKNLSYPLYSGISEVNDKYIWDMEMIALLQLKKDKDGKHIVEEDRYIYEMYAADLTGLCDLDVDLMENDRDVDEGYYTPLLYRRNIKNLIYPAHNWL